MKLADRFTDVPLTEIAKRGNGKAMISHLDELSSPRVTKLRKAGASWDDVWTLAKGDNLGVARRFERKGIADVDDMVYYTKKGVHPKVVKSLREHLSPKQTRDIIRFASGAGWSLNKYSKIKGYCGWQEQKGFTHNEVEKSCNAIQPG